jgi:hypothetical protein
MAMEVARKGDSGLDIEITGLLGIYNDPAHVIAYADGEVRLEFNIEPFHRDGAGHGRRRRAVST